MKKRFNICNITNELASGQGLYFDLETCYNAIFDYCKRTNTLATARKNRYSIIDGGLFINDCFVVRVAPLPKKIGFCEESLYWEGRILARAEEGVI